ncbi:TPA: hypothetical protein ACOFD8_000752 [Stenotrophomonas maltophilia]
MASELKLYLQPLNASKWPLSYDHAHVAAAFAPPSLSPLPHPHAVDTLLAALDCGYGNILAFLGPPAAVPAPAFTNMGLTTKAEWVQLGRYIYSKVNLLGDIFGTTVVAGAPCVNALPFVPQLEKNEKGSFSYFLGMVYARHALEQVVIAAPAAPGFVSRILHFHTGQGGPIQIQGLPFPLVGAAKDAPDFLVQLNNATWGLLEAKGSLGARVNKKLEEAQQQVDQYPMVNFSVGGGTPALLAISFCAISYAYVQNGNLQVEYIDPEPDNDALERVRRGDAWANPVFMPAADCLSFLQACGHFGSQAEDGGEAEQYMHWTRFKDGLWLGLPNGIWSRFDKLVALMTLFEAVFGNGCVESCAPLIEESSVDFDVRFSEEAIFRLHRLADDEAFPFHQHASGLLARVGASRRSNEAIRLGAFAQDVAGPKTASGMIANLNGLLHSLRKYSYLKFGDEPDLHTRFLSNGLCIADDAGRQFLDSNPLPDIRRF